MLLTIREAAAQYGISAKRIRTALDNGELVCYPNSFKTNTGTMLYRTDLETWITST